MDRGRTASRTRGLPDIMNDPAYAPGRGDKGKGVDEVDTCRICRGEGTEGDELFYPCKCSGSIKFVHQGCLTEWLSHSQKKYCELCKTPFRFTKLYDPNMPQELPVPVFLKELVLHAGRSLLTWLRFMLVAFVWLGWLPWSMRALWRGLFWMADGRWPGGLDNYQNGGMSATDGTTTHLGPLGTSPASSTLASNSPPAATSMQSMAMAIPQILAPVSSILNFSDGEPLIYSLAKSIITNTFVASTLSSDPSGTSPTNTTVSSVRRSRQPSWLSDISFLNKLTPYPTLNNILIDTLEGQLITLLVVISFILIFLIREWVVQQQPVLNLGEGEREVAVQLMAEEPRNRHHGPGQGDGQHHDAADAEPEEEPEPEVANELEEDAASASGASPTIGSLRDSEFHVPEASAVRPQFPSAEPDRESTEEPETVLEGISQRSSTNEIVPESPETVADFIRKQKQPTNNAFTNTPSSDDFWQPHEHLPESELQDDQENMLGSNVSIPTTSRAGHGYQAAERGVNGTRIDSEGVGLPQSGFDISLPPMQPKSPLFSGNSEEGGAGSSQAPSSLFNDNEPISSGRIQLPSPGPSKIGAYSDKHSDSHSDDSRDTLGKHDEPAEARDVQHPLTPTSVDNTSEVEIDEVQAPADSLEQTYENGEESETVNEQPVFAERVANWLWGDIPIPVQQQQDQQGDDDDGVDDDDDEHIVEDPAREAPFIPVRHHDGNIDVARDEPDQGAAPGDAGPDAGADGNDADAVDDADDLEGIMELVGMQGPIFGLLQNGVFSALLIAFTVAAGIWLPYIGGKVGLVLMTHPLRFLILVPLNLVAIVAGIAADSFIASIAYFVYSANFVVRMTVTQLAKLVPALQKLSEYNAVASASMSLMEGSGGRLKRVMTFVLALHETGRPTFSMLARQALRIHQARLAAAVGLIMRIGRAVVHDFPVLLLTTRDYASLLREAVLSAPVNLRQTVIATISGIKEFSSTTLKVLNLSYLTADDEDVSFSLDPELARWDTKDRVIAILVGYCCATLVGLVYLRVAGIFNNSVHRQQRANGAVADGLRQAGGVMKVVLIIGIEMIVFPLYCGILLDIALLPLFETATVISRGNFTKESPLTSLFVHWFVGTCYMFHFALFVSMCRKILRRGVLYFIRDPDDPTFHPVRDVLERSIATQLRKIAFSALVYGALVIVCLGGVVWGLAHFAKGVLPLHWSSNEPVLEFPVDLLFYNFVVPLAIRSIKPSDSLYQMYDWWFHKCARLLRLTDFLLGGRKHDEEGRHTNHTWYEALSTAAASLTSMEAEHHTPATPAEHGRATADFIRDGRFVRTPGSDQVRIPKGAPVFVEVNENNERSDGRPDHDAGLHGRANEMFSKVYIPPSFRARISIFIFLIWVFAAVTGVGTTVLPLLLGRKMISFLFPAHLQVNDIYAFSAGICLVGGLAYAAVHYRQLVTAVARYLRQNSSSPARILSEMYEVVCRALRLTYASGALVLLFPSIFALLSELYFILPLHTYIYGDKAHVIHFIQDWTLGVLYLRMALRFISWHPTSRLALALEAVTRSGWLNPDMKLATRAFIIPASVVALVALLGPLPIGFLLSLTVFRQAPPAVHSQVYRYCYPGFLLAILLVFAARWLRRQIGVWRVSIRDDVYLIGERLHNFGGRGAMDVGVTRRMMT